MSVVSQTLDLNQEIVSAIGGESAASVPEVPASTKVEQDLLVKSTVAEITEGRVTLTEEVTVQRIVESDVKTDLLEIQHTFTEGDAVEVCFNDEGIKGAWYSGVITKLEDDSARVKVNELLADDEKTNFEEVFSVDKDVAPGFNVKRIRPSVPTPGAGKAEAWAKGDPVEVLFQDAWWEGIIISVKGKSATVYYPGTKTTEQAKVDKIRRGISLLEGKWVTNKNKSEIPDQPATVTQSKKRKAVENQDGKAPKRKKAVLTSEGKGSRVSKRTPRKTVKDVKAKVTPSKASKPKAKPSKAKTSAPGKVVAAQKPEKTVTAKAKKSPAKPAKPAKAAKPAVVKAKAVTKSPKRTTEKKVRRTSLGKPSSTRTRNA